jgi:hypothetical protein
MTKFEPNLLKPDVIVQGVRVVAIGDDPNFKGRKLVEMEIKAPPFKEDPFYYLTRADVVCSYLVNEGFLPAGRVNSKIRPV